MDTLQLIASATGIGFLAGIRLYLTVLTLGLAVRFEWLRLNDSFSELSILGNWWVIGFAAAAALIEFFSDKIPWLDSAWPYFASGYGVLKDEKIQPTGYYLLVRQNGQMHRFKYKKQAYYPLTKPGEVIMLPVQRGIFGPRVVLLK